MEKDTHKCDHMGIVNSIINLGTSGIPKGQTRLTRVLNKINLLSIILALALLVINVLSQLWVQAACNAASILLVFIPVYVLNHYHKHQWSRVLFVFGLTSSVAGISIFNVINGRATNTEIIILAICSFIIIIFEGRTQIVLYLFTAFSLFLIEFLKDYYLRDLMWSNAYFFTLINYSVTLIGVFYFTQIFKSELDRAVGKVSKLNDELEKSRFILSSLIDNTPLFLAMIDSKGKYRVVNKKYEEAFQMTKAQFSGKHYKEVLDEEMAAFHEPLIHRCMGGEVVDFYQQIESTKGLYQHSYGKYFPVFNDLGEVQYITVFVTDISELKKAEAQLQELNATKNRLFSVLAHDIISPINLLRNTLYLSEHEDAIGENDLREFLHRAKGHLLVLIHMMENLLRWGKSQFHGWTSDPEEINVKPVIQGVLNVYRDHSKRKNLKVNFELDTNLTITADKGHLELILRNLIVNAFKFSNTNGLVDIQVCLKQGDMIISVSDQGCGMNKALLERIQSGKSIESEMGTDGESGTGLGLQLCFDVALKEGWVLNVLSGAQKGTSFVLTIPNSVSC